MDQSKWHCVDAPNDRWHCSCVLHLPQVKYDWPQSHESLDFRHPLAIAEREPQEPLEAIRHSYWERQMQYPDRKGWRPV